MVGPAWLFSPLDIVVELPLVQRVGGELGVDTLIVVIDKDCLALQIAWLRGRGDKRSDFQAGAIGCASEVARRRA